MTKNIEIFESMMDSMGFKRVTPKFEVHWLGPKGGKRVDETHGTFDTIEEAEQSIWDWWKKNDFRPPYVRTIRHDDITTIDYGSHTRFYEIREVQA